MSTPQVTVSITSGLKYYIGTEPVRFNQLEARLQKELRYRPDPTLSIHADKSVPVEHVVNVMNIAKRNKYKVILATSPE